MRFYLRAISYFKDDLAKIISSLVVIAAMTACGLLQVYPLAILTDNVFGPYSPSGWVSRLFFHSVANDKVKQVIALGVIVLVLRLVQEVLQMTMTILNIKIGYNGLMRVRCDLFKSCKNSASRITNRNRRAMRFIACRGTHLAFKRF